MAGFVGQGLTKAGFSVDRVALAEEASAALAAARYDAIVLDLGLPDHDGMTVIKDLRDRRQTTPVLILTARDSLEDKITGLNQGADDYLLKPFEMEELIARLKALLRRPGQALGLTLTAGNLSFDTNARTVQVDKDPVLLSRREMALLELLLRRCGRVVAKDAIEENLYGFGEEVTTNSIEVLVHRLRKKLLNSGASLTVHTVRGVGYLLAEGAEVATGGHPPMTPAP